MIRLVAEVPFSSPLAKVAGIAVLAWIKASNAVRLNTIAAVACAMVVGALLYWNAWTFAYIIWIGTSPLPFGDQWDASLFPDETRRNLFALHNEHRPVLGRLVGVLDWYLADARNWLTTAFIAACYPVYVLALFKLVNTIVADSRRSVVFVGLASAIILSGAQWENLLSAFQITFVGSFVFAFLALLFAALAAPPSPSSGWRTANFLLCLFASFFAVFSLASGLLVLPFVAALFFILGASPRLKYGYIFFATAAITFYFYGYASPSVRSNPLVALRDVWAVGRFALVYVGSPFTTRGDPDVAAVVGAVGLMVLIALLADAVITFLREPRLRQAPEGAGYVVLLLFAVFIFCAAGLTALGRVDFGIEEALAFRYATPAVFFWGDLVAACLVRPYLRQTRGSRILHWGGAGLGIALASHVAFYQRSYVASVYDKRTDRFNAAIAYLLGIRNQPTVLQLYPVAAAVLAGHLDEPFQRLQRSHKSIFTDDWAARLGTPLREWKHDVSPACRGAIERRAVVPDQAVAIAELAGWAWDDERRRVPDLIVFTDPRDLVIGFAAPGFRRVDVRERHTSVTSSASGWNGFVRADQTVTIHAHAVMFGRSNRACEFATSSSSQ